MVKIQDEAIDYVENIRQSGLSIYDPIDIQDKNLRIPSKALEKILNDALVGRSFPGMPIKTRSKKVKELICEALGYAVPKSFKKHKPRFLGQGFDTQTLKNKNLQIWNEPISESRRYVLLQLNADHDVIRVKVVDGGDIKKLDKTGKLTQKYQARLTIGKSPSELISSLDTEYLSQFVSSNTHHVKLRDASPTDSPTLGNLLPIAVVFEKLKLLIGTKFDDAGSDQERNRGAILHRLISEQLGFGDHRDDGQFPDIRNQLIEVKLQTSTTIDLGLVLPNSNELLAKTMIGENIVRHCDVRYALFYGQIQAGVITLTNFFLTTGEMFFERFPQFQGKVLNRKLQIPLPRSFFDIESEDLPD